MRFKTPVKVIPGARVKAARLYRKISQTELANRLGVSTTTINYRERNRVATTLESWIATCSVLDISLDWGEDIVDQSEAATMETNNTEDTESA